jgi:proteasome lid subunit RPN8/RPN11
MISTLRFLAYVSVETPHYQAFFSLNRLAIEMYEVSSEELSHGKKGASTLTLNEKSLIVSNVAILHISNHGRKTYPNECCGALIGNDNVVTECVSLPNTAKKGLQYRFLVTPDNYQIVERHAMKCGQKLIGFYHSHPDHPAHPSQYDLDHAWPIFEYVIIAVENGEPGEITSWRLRENRSAFDETRIERKN